MPPATPPGPVSTPVCSCNSARLLLQLRPFTPVSGPQPIDSRRETPPESMNLRETELCAVDNLCRWITRQKGAWEGAGWPSAAGPVGTAWPPQTAWQGRAAADRSQRTSAPCVSSRDGEQRAPERPRKSANVSLADIASAIDCHKTPAFVGFPSCSKTTAHKSAHNSLPEGRGEGAPTGPRVQNRTGRPGLSEIADARPLAPPGPARAAPRAAPRAARGT